CRAVLPSCECSRGEIKGNGSDPAPATAARLRRRLRDCERLARQEGPLYVLLSRSWTRRSRPRSSEQKSQGRKATSGSQRGVWAWVPRRIAGERAVCAARRSSVVDGRSSLVGSPGAQAPSGILGMRIRSL
ncbi:unnamed protein product, partial [Rangifer tarandus platyrhynchus]